MAGALERSMEDAPKAVGLQRRHIVAVTLGNALEFYDFLIYAFFAIQIGHAFFPTQSVYGSLMLSLATFGAGFVTRPIGAMVIGAYADRVGRRPAMILSFALMGGSIIAMALIPPYAVIGVTAPVMAVLVRMVQGFSLGGEVGSNTTFLLEAAPPDKRGLMVSWQGVSQYLALIVGSLVGIVLTATLPHGALDAYGWRIAFLLGAVTLPFGLWLRRSLPETLHEPEAHAVAAAINSSRLHLARQSSRTIVLGLIAIATFTIGTYIFNYIVTYAQNALHMSASAGFVAVLGGNALGIFGVLYGGGLSDRIGRRPVNVWGHLVLLVLIYPVFHWIVATRSDFALIVGMLLLSGSASFTSGSFFAGLLESLPKPIRSSGFGTVYAVSVAAFGGTTQLVVTWLIHVTGSPMAPAWYLLAVTAVGQVALMLIPESAPVRVATSTNVDVGAVVSVEI